MLEDLGIADTDIHCLRRFLDRARLEESQFENATVTIGKGSEDFAGPLRAGKILASLPDRYRRILELRFLEACTIKEAAQAMNVSVSNAKVLQHRALRMAAKAGLELEQ